MPKSIRALIWSFFSLNSVACGFIFPENGKFKHPIDSCTPHQENLKLRPREYTLKTLLNDEEGERVDGTFNRRDFTAAAVSSLALSQFASQVQANGLLDFFSRENIQRKLFNPDYEVRPLEPYISLLPESALLYLLPVNSRPLRQIQKQIERINAVRAAYILNGNTSVIPDETWKTIEQTTKVSIATLAGSRDKLSPPFSESASAEVQVKLAEKFESRYADLKYYLTELGNAASERDVLKLLESQRLALLTLGFIGEALVEDFPYEIPEKKKYTTVPRLLGRTVVDLLIERPSANPGERILGNVTIIVDGYSAPITGGNFVDLCQRGFYDELPFTWDKVFSDTDNYTVPVGGTYRDGFVDPVTGKVRRVPLEILRYNVATQKQIPQYGTVNSKLFTKDPIIQSFKIYGAVSMFHPYNDKNGASSQFWFLPGGLNRSKNIGNLDENFAIFGYIVSGKEIIDQLQKGDQIKKAYVGAGIENLRKMKPNFFKTLVETFKEEE
mmetsp:Transcript_15771/g.19763  ORF Transcript_15771/g.19763 Transcript_15771/m.19763 type:complete len:499 (+) Transcript_15771:55-1551(+)